MVGGDRAPVYSLGAAVGQYSASDDAAKGRDRHIVVLRGPSGPVGWLLDRVGRSRLPVRTPVLPLPTAVGARARRWFGGVLSTDDRTLLLLSLSHAERQQTSAARTGHDATAADTAAPATSNDGGPLIVTFGTAALPPCGATRHAISARRVAGLESALHVASVPGSEPPVIGVSVWRGEVLPVIDFRHAVPAREFERQRHLIIRCGGALAGMSVAIPIDAETALHQPTGENRRVDLVDMRPGEVPAFVTGLFDVRGHTVALIDPDTLMTAAFCATSAA